jgi:hypothetical protein
MHACRLSQGLEKGGRGTACRRSLRRPYAAWLRGTNSASATRRGGCGAEDFRCVPKPDLWFARVVRTAIHSSLTLGGHING